MPAWVLLRHDLPDGSWHLDWLIEPFAAAAPGHAVHSPAPQPDHRVLISFRLAAGIGARTGEPSELWRPDIPPFTRFEGERLAPHRRRYLTHEGPILSNPNLGTVRRVAAAPEGVLSLEERPDRLRLALRACGPGQAAVTWEAVPDPARATVWHFAPLAAADAPLSAPPASVHPVHPLGR